MKSFLVGASAATLLVAGTAQGAVPRFYQDPNFKSVTNLTQQTELPATLSHLRIENASGSVHVHGGDTAATRCLWKMRVCASTEDLARELAGRVTFRTEVNGDEVKVVVAAPELVDARAIESDFEITVPRSVSVETKTRNGLIDIADLSGDVIASNENGPVGIHRIGGTVHAETSGARLAVSHTAGATLRNHNGEIDVTDINGALDAHTSFAALEAENVEGGATLVSENGDVQASYIRGGMDANAMFGSINAHDIEGPVVLRSQNGNVAVARSNGVATKEPKTIPAS